MSRPNTRVANLKGEGGSQFISTATTAYVPVAPATYFDSFTCTAAGTFAFVDPTCGGDATGAVVLPAGITIHGHFTKITPASGAGYAYNGF